MKQQVGFKTTTKNNNSYYDLYEDWDLIESSITKQYGIRIRQNTDMEWNEFCNLISGLMPDTPLGQIISIRAEKDKDTIKNFNSSQKAIHRDWQNKMIKAEIENKEELDLRMQRLEASMKSMFG